jgi:hypothetical protein
MITAQSWSRRRPRVQTTPGPQSHLKVPVSNPLEGVPDSQTDTSDIPAFEAIRQMKSVWEEPDKEEAELKDVITGLHQRLVKLENDTESNWKDVNHLMEEQEGILFCAVQQSKAK